ncbi:hypothetical protein C8Q75DRAFT_805989 [Abortiporus biennis]|nr:hypothetical protein C8Q75DRAFT_805989 [Abortiporus biennis]
MAYQSALTGTKGHRIATGRVILTLAGTPRSLSPSRCNAARPLASPSTPGSRLSWDILFVILSLTSDTKTHSAFMRTCRTLYKEGISHLLQIQGATTFDYTDRRLASFCRFMLSGTAPSNRIRHLSTLDLVQDNETSPKNLKPCTLTLLSTLLRSSTSLTYLAVEKCEALLETGEQFQRAIMHLNHLRILKLRQVGNRSIAMLQKLNAGLVDIEISHDPNSDVPAPDPLTMLSAHAEMLQSLKLTLFSVENATIRFSNITSLWLHSIAIVMIQPLAEAFPNLVNLRVGMVEDMDIYLSGDIDKPRDANYAAQAEDNLRLARLEKLSGSLVSLYCLSVVIHVPRLLIEGVLPDLPTVVSEVIEDISPTELEMSVMSFALGWDEDLWTQILESSPELARLHLTITVTDRDLSRNLEENLLSVLSKSSVSTLLLTFNTLDLTGHGSQPQSPEISSENINESRIKDIGHRVASVTRGLKVFSISAFGEFHWDWRMP